MALANIATVDYHTGKLAQAVAEFENSMSLTRAIGNRESLAYQLTYMGRISISRGDLTAARKYLNESISVLTAARQVITDPPVWLAEIDVLEGHPEAAEAPMMALAARYNKPSPAARVWRVLALSWLARGEIAKARHAADRAVEISAASANRADYGIPAELVSARVAVAEKHYTKAESMLTSLLAESRRLGNVPEELTARLEMGEVAAHGNNIGRAAALLRDLQRDARGLGFTGVQYDAQRLAEIPAGPLSESSCPRVTIPVTRPPPCSEFRHATPAAR
jgi:tetratricopeptide (TPR) repeat protein